MRVGDEARRDRAEWFHSMTSVSNAPYAAGPTTGRTAPEIEPAPRRGILPPSAREIEQLWDLCRATLDLPNGGTHLQTEAGHE